MSLPQRDLHVGPMRLTAEPTAFRRQAPSPRNICRPRPGCNGTEQTLLARSAQAARSAAPHDASSQGPLVCQWHLTAEGRLICTWTHVQSAPASALAE
jgi:hypothetical protein